MASLIAILDLKGKPLIQRSYRDDVPPSYVERFLPLVLEIEEDGQQVTPFLALSKRNSNAAEIILFLHRLTQVLIEYFKELEEESIRDNFVIIYELMDEMMDFGYPQTTESKILQEYITQESYKLEVQVRPPMAVTNAVSWRTEGIRYRKNEVFLDVIESVNMLVNANGNVVRSEILGAIKMKCYLSGMPELRLGLNDKVMFESTGRTARGKAIEMEDVKFHQCVRLSRFENDRTISFIPPDGEFELMSYRLSTPVKPLVWVEAAVESHKGSRVEYVVKVKAQFKRRSTANNVEIYVPVPDDADSPKFRASTGTVQYAPDKSAFVWKIKQLGGSREFLMRAHFGLPSVKSENDIEKRAPITVKFEIPYFTVSGIQVRYLKIVEKSGYQALPWVRYITQNGDDYRTSSLTSLGRRGYAEVNDKLKLSLVLPHQSIFTSTDVVQVNIAAESGDMGILANHVPSIEPLRPGVVEVLETNGSSKKWFTSSGFATVHPNNRLTINVVEAAPLENFSIEAIRANLADALKVASGNGSEADKAEARIEADVYEALQHALGK
ncbi:AP-1 complex subunit mu-1 [Arthromyces matolae]|nr:AP-1 complex subunit mu-1 [Arthromyces matolae]